MKIFFSRTFAVALVLLVLTATGLWAAGAEEERVAAADKKYVTDPATGKVVTAPEYGGTITYAKASMSVHTSVYHHDGAAEPVSGVLEKLGVMDWAIDRDIYSFRTTYKPDFALRGHLAESWETPDPLTYIFHIRRGVQWQDKAPMNGRELTAYDVEYHYHRYIGIGSGFTEPAERYAAWPFVTLPYESITATDKYTMVVKLTSPDPDALMTLTTNNKLFIEPPEVIKEKGDLLDWRNVVGTGPFELTDWVDGVSVSWGKNPDYWGYDEKYPENRLPYIDGLTALIMPDEATRIAALRSGKIDLLAMFVGYGQIASIDQVESLKKTNPELKMEWMSYRSMTSWTVNTSRPPFDDVRVRHAMQMALDLETINNTYWGGQAMTTPQGYFGAGFTGYVTPYEDWPEEIKGYYSYDPEGAEALLDEAGYPRGADGIRFNVVLDVGVPIWDPAYNQVAADYWAKIGVDAKIVTGEWPAIAARVTGDRDFDMYAFISGNEWNPMAQAQQMLSDSSTNWPALRDPVYEAMVADAAAATTTEERQRLFKLIDAYNVEEHWYIWGSRVPQFNVVQPWLVGYAGEGELGETDRQLIAARVWIDSALKKEMGF